MNDDFFNDALPQSPHSQMSGSPSAPMAEASFASNDGGSPHSLPGNQQAPPPPSAAAPPSAPWDDDDWGTPAAAPPQQPSPKAALPVDDDFFSSSPSTAAEPAAGTTTGPEAPADKPVNPTAFDALQKQIANRTAAFDAATKKKEAEITAAATEYIKQQKAKREKEVADAKTKHKQEQQEGAKKIDEYRKSGAVWSAVGLLVDLQKPNPYAKNTERMRSVLSTLNTMEKPGGAPNAAAAAAK